MATISCVSRNHNLWDHELFAKSYNSEKTVLRASVGVLFHGMMVAPIYPLQVWCKLQKSLTDIVLFLATKTSRQLMDSKKNGSDHNRPVVVGH